MFFFLSKLLPLFVYPVGLSIILLVAALFFHKRRRVQQTCNGLALAILLLFSNDWVSEQLLRPLEWRHLPAGEIPQAEAIVLLGGGTRPLVAPRQISEMSEGGDRLVYAAQLYHAGKAPFILVCGGAIELYGSSVPESEAMLELLIVLGVPEEAIVLESESRNTHENATNARAIANALEFNEILLVTSAIHMPRSVAIFENLEFDVIPAPVDFLTTQSEAGRTVPLGVDGWALKIMPNVERLDFSTRAMREYIGIFVYWLRGWL